MSLLLAVLTPLLALCQTGAAEQISIAVSPEVDISVGSPVRLDIEVRDIGGNPVPWEDFVEHHARKIHVYAVDEV